MKYLHFKLLGSPVVEYQGQALTIPRRQVRALLYLFALDQKPIPLDRLCCYFWQDRSEQYCRRNLSHLFTHLRKHIPVPELLQVDRVSARLNNERILSDVQQFARLSQLPEAPGHIDQFVTAVNLYQGELLAGENFSSYPPLEALIEQNKKHFSRLYLKNLSKLTRLYFQAREFELAVDYAEKYLSMDNISEEMNILLIRLYAMVGQKRLAVQQFESCKEVYSSELNVQPPRGIFRAYEESVANTNENHIKLAGQHGGSELRTSECRYRHLGAYELSLRELIESNNGAGGVISIVGEAGSGKSTLLSRYFEHEVSFHFLFRSRFTPATSAIPGYPFVRIAEEITKSANGSNIAMAEISNEVVSAAGSIIEAHRNLTNRHEMYPENFAVQRLYLLDTLFDSLTSKFDRVYLVIEELQWVDAASLNMLLYLAQRYSSRGLFLVVSYCCAQHKDLVSFINKCELSSVYLGNLKLSEINFSEAKSIVQCWMNDFQSVDAYSSWLLKFAGGNPYYIAAILEWLTKIHVSVEECIQADMIMIPQDLIKEILARFNHLSRSEKEILQAAAVKNDSIGYEDLKKMPGLDLSEAINHLDQLVVRNLLVPDGTSFQFKHGMMKQILSKEMSPARRKLLEDVLNVGKHIP